jgi:hypothetical protein
MTYKSFLFSPAMIHALHMPMILRAFMHCKTITYKNIYILYKSIIINRNHHVQFSLSQLLYRTFI